MLLAGSHPASHGVVFDDAGGCRGGGGAMVDAVMSHRVDAWYRRPDRTTGLARGQLPLAPVM